VSAHSSMKAAIAVLLFAAPLAAQSVSQGTAGINAAPVVAAAPAPVETAASAPSLAPRQGDEAVGIRATPVAFAAAPAPAPDRIGRSPAMMIVGGAALLVGAVVGGKSGTIIMIGGGVIGLIGLWNYLK
jgi:hypothetical protein